MCEGENSRDRLALCLSGGGFRATLFHLGVVKALRSHRFEGEMALNLVSEVYAVSGGSILAAHMLVNWSRYTDPDDAVFAGVENEIRDFAATSVRDRILRRWFLTRWLGGLVGLLSRVPLARGFVGNKAGLFGRTYWLQRQYERRNLVGTIGIGEATSGGSFRPEFHFLSTSFKTGELCSFSGDRFEVEEREVDLSVPQTVTPPPRTTPSGHIRLSFAVAASSAFPPMFPPIELTDKQLANPKGEAFLNSISLSDGGVYDNLGIEKFRRNLARNPNHPAKLIISDAGGSFQASAEKSYDHLVARNVRASDILMHRVGDKLKADIGRLDTVEDVTVRISDTLSIADVDEAVQQRLRLVRTDLDRFEGRLADLLIGHGARLAKVQIAALFPADGSQELAPPTSSTAETEALDSIAQRAANRSFASLLFGRDWLSPVFLPIFLAVLVTVAGAIPFGIWKFVESAKLAEEKSQQATLLQTRIDQSSAAFGSLLGACLEKQVPCKAEDYRQLAYHLEVALKDAAAAVNDREPVRQAAIVAGPIGQTPDPVLPRPANQVYVQKVYVQFAGLMKREEINGLYTSLRGKGWYMQGKTGERLPVAYGLNEVRYSLPENRPAAEALAEAITVAGITADPVEARENRVIGPNTLEVWISR